MRPVIRRDWPKNEDGNEIKYERYGNARGKLIENLGEFCSYCEMHLDTSLAVEHVRPKKPRGTPENIEERELNWNNFLLACTNCNSTKGSIDVVLDSYFWPDKDNTFFALVYSEGGVVLPAQHLSDEQKEIAKNTIKLTGLDKTPLNIPATSDRRWINRKETWEIAERQKERLTRHNNEDFRENIKEFALAKGYWSIWMTTFQSDTDMLKRLIEAFPGTCSECFSSDYSPIHREGGQI